MSMVNLIFLRNPKIYLPGFGKIQESLLIFYVKRICRKIEYVFKADRIFESPCDSNNVSFQRGMQPYTALETRLV